MYIYIFDGMQKRKERVFVPKVIITRMVSIPNWGFSFIFLSFCNVLKGEVAGSHFRY